MAETSALTTLLVAMLAGALRVSTPFLFVSLGECLTEKSGRINLGNEGVLVFGAMAAYAISYETGNPWIGVLAAAASGAVIGAIHAALCSLRRVSDIAMGIAIMLAGTGLAFFLGKPYVQPSAPLLPPIPLGFWSDVPQIRSALDVSPLFFLGLIVAGVLTWGFRRPASATPSASSAIAPTRRRRWASRSSASASSPPPPAARSPASAAPSSRSAIREAGTRACRPARA